MTTDTPNNTPTYKAWIENGVLYHEYTNDITLTNVLEMEKTSLALIEQYKLRTLPVIVILRNIDQTNFKLTFADFGRVLSTFDLARHASSIWIIGVTEEVKKTILTISNYFEVNHIFFADNLPIAQEAAYLAKSTKKSILDS